MHLSISVAPKSTWKAWWKRCLLHPIKTNYEWIEIYRQLSTCLTRMIDLWIMTRLLTLIILPQDTTLSNQSKKLAEFSSKNHILRSRCSTSRNESNSLKCRPSWSRWLTGIEAVFSSLRGKLKSSKIKKIIQLHHLRRSPITTTRGWDWECKLKYIRKIMITAKTPWRLSNSTSNCRESGSSKSETSNSTPWMSNNRTKRTKNRGIRKIP